jgi:hypothetical protein
MCRKNKSKISHDYETVPYGGTNALLVMFVKVGSYGNEQKVQYLLTW